MDFSEFRRRLGAEPRRQDDEMRAARRDSAEFEAAAVEAERFEDRLQRAVALPVPDDLVEDLVRLRAPQNRRWWPAALAAGLLLAVTAAGVTWKQQHSWDSVEDYVVDHYRHDGTRVIAMLERGAAPPVEELLAEFRLAAAPGLADIIGVIKVCPTPGGRGVHMVLNTDDGPLTVIYMPDTPVTDHERLAFDGLEAMLVELPRGSAVVIGHAVQDYYAMVHDSLLPLGAES